jgi:type VI secretion system protein ImpH
MRNAADPVNLLAQLAERPYAFDFFHVLRWLEARHPQLPRFGEAARPADEAVRIGQEPLLDFAPAAISGVRAARGQRPAVIEVRFLGLFGPNGPLPLHLTEYARERLLHHGDATFARFVDLINHRFVLLFYRAWAQAQPVASLDRRGDDRFARYVGSLYGAGFDSSRDRDEAADELKLFHSGSLARQARNADGLRALLERSFAMPVRVQEYVAQWLPLPRDERSRLGANHGTSNLGQGLVLGGAIWDGQSSIRLHFRVASLREYQEFLPGGPSARRLVALMRAYLGWELRWDARVSLAGDEVPITTMGRAGRLGWTTWLGGEDRSADADDLLLDYESAQAA